MATYTAMTLNSAFLPRVPGSPSLPDYDFRADKIAERIEELKIDILVLNEVFVPEIRKRLIRSLEKEYSIPAGINMAFFADGVNVATAEAGERNFAGSTTSAAKMTIRDIEENPALTPRERNLAIASAIADVPFVESGLFLALRKGRGIIPGTFPVFTPWENRGIESVSARMGYFLFKIGLKHTEIPASLYLFGLHMNPFNNHSDIRLSQLKQLREKIASMDDGVAAPFCKLLLGDFNIVGESVEYDSTIAGGVLPGCVDLFRISHPEDHGYTWSKDNPLTDFAIGGSGSNERLDYILSASSSRCKKKIKVDLIKVEKMEVPEYTYGYVSDHFGVKLTFDIIDV